MSERNTVLEQQCVNAVRMLAVDEVEKAKSGHPGMPLGAAPMAYALWSRFLRHNPADPHWADRDRFILSAGHGSALLYALLHLSGYDLPLEELKNFRQWGSATPGHPEYGHTPGVEVTTGPLGQGFAMGVGMAMAERFLAARFNRPGFTVIDHHTYAIVSDGDLMEGIASEAASLAAHQRLGKLVYLYDDNHISIEGDTGITFTEDVLARFAGYGWHVQRVADGEDLDAIERAVAEARAESDRPSLIAVRTHIGFGSPKQDSASAHGEPLGEAAMKATREALGWTEFAPFEVPDEVRAAFAEVAKQGTARQAAWKELFVRYAKEYPAEAAQLRDELAGVLPQRFAEAIPAFAATDAMASRDASGKVLNGIAAVLPNLIGGSADLGPSVKTFIAGAGECTGANPVGRNIHFGVREHAMGAIANGMALHGGMLPFCSTFFIFTDYMRPAIRLAAIQKAHTIFVLSHDSIGVGEDGPTHQPIEHLASLRAMPGLTVIRPADANETAAAWRLAIERKTPTALVLSRQKLNGLGLDPAAIREGTTRGAYVVADGGPRPDVMLIATGSEVQVAVSAAAILAKQQVRARVISMPSWELFEEQPQSYRDEVLLPATRARVAVEAGTTFGWQRYVGIGGRAVGIDRFGASAPGNVLMEKLGITAEAVAEAAKQLLSARTIDL